MSLTLTRMRYWLRKGLGGLDSNELDDTDADELLNMALWELDNKYPFKEKECLVTASTVAGQRSYTVPNNLDAIRTVSVVDDDDSDDPADYHYLREMTNEWFENNAADDDEDERAMPERWLRRDDALILHPWPDAVYTLRLEMWRTVESLVSGSVDTPELPRNWHEIVVEKAIERGHFYNADYNLAQQAANFPIGKERGAVLDVTKEEEGVRFAGLDVQWDDPTES